MSKCEQEKNILAQPTLTTSTADSLKQNEFALGDWPEKNWWEMFQSEELSALIASALVSNPTPIVMNDLWKFSPTTGWWTWVNGPNTTGSVGSYGTKGVAAVGNLPPARRDGVGWIDRARVCCCL